MTGTFLLCIGSALVILWSIAHIVPTKSVVEGFGPLTDDNKRIITMEWVAEGLALSFIGLLVLAVVILGDTHNPVSVLVFRASALMLLVLAGWTAVTGARTSIVPIKICPLILTLSAVLILLGSFL